MDDKTLMYLAGQLLADLGPEGIPPLLERVESANPDIRVIAIQYLGDMGPQAVAALPALEKAKDDPDLRIAAIARWAARKIRSNATP